MNTITKTAMVVPCCVANAANFCDSLSGYAYVGDGIAYVTDGVKAMQIKSLSLVLDVPVISVDPGDIVSAARQAIRSGIANGGVMSAVHYADTGTLAVDVGDDECDGVAVRTTSKRSIIKWLDAAFADAKPDRMETRLRVDEVLAVLTLMRDCGITTVSLARLAGNREGGPDAGSLAVSGSDDNFRVSAILAPFGG